MRAKTLSRSRVCLLGCWVQGSDAGAAVTRSPGKGRPAILNPEGPNRNQSTCFTKEPALSRRSPGTAMPTDPRTRSTCSLLSHNPDLPDRLRLFLPRNTGSALTLGLGFCCISCQIWVGTRLQQQAGDLGISIAGCCC